MAMNRWGVVAVAATVVSAIAILSIWAFGIHGSGKTVTIRIPQSGNSGEYRWASKICAAITDWDRSWVDAVIEPTAPANARAKAPPIGRTLNAMRELTGQVRSDIAAIDPPTKHAREAQDYIRITPMVEARELATMKPSFSLKEFAVFHIRSRAAAVNFIGRKMRVEMNWLIKQPGYASPYVGVALQDSPDCADISRLRRLDEWR